MWRPTLMEDKSKTFTWEWEEGETGEIRTIKIPMPNLDRDYDPSESHDFKQAQRFARYILRRKLHDVRNPHAVAKLVHLAFNTSLIVAYCRPFHKGNDGLKIRVPLDPRKID